MSRPRRVHTPLLRLRGVDVPRIHRPAPVVVIEIADGDGDRRSERLAAPHPAHDLRLVVLDFHPSAPPVPMLPTREVAVDALAVERHARRHAGDDDGELRPMRLAGGSEGEAHVMAQFIVRAPSSADRRGSKFEARMKRLELLLRSYFAPRTSDLARRLTINC